MAADSVGFSAGSGSSTSASASKAGDQFQAAASKQKQVPDSGVDNTPAKPPTPPKKEEPVEAGLKPGEKKPAETKRPEEKKPAKPDPNNNPGNPNASGWSQSNSGNSGGQDKEGDEKKQKKDSGGDNGAVQGPQEANAWDVGWAGYTSTLNSQSITGTTTPKGPPVVDPLLGSVVTGANGGGKPEAVDAAGAAAELAAQGGPSLIDMATLDPSVNVSQAVAGAALARFDPASMELPQVQAEMTATLQVHQALLDDLIAQSDAHKDSHLDLHKSVVEKNGQNLTATESNYAAERADYAEKVSAAQALVDADKAALQVVDQLLADPNGPPKPVGAFYTAEAAPNMAYQVPLYQRPIVEGGKTIGVELIDLTNPFDVRYYQGYSPDVDTAMQGALGDYQFIRPLPQGTLMVMGDGGPIAYATGGSAVDAGLAAKNNAALINLQGGTLPPANAGRPGFANAINAPARGAFWAGIIPWTISGAVHVSQQGALRLLFPPAPGANPTAYTPPATWLSAFGALGMVGGLMTFINDVTSVDNRRVGVGYTLLQGTRDLNGVYRSGVITTTGLNAASPVFQQFLTANPFLKNVLQLTVGDAIKPIPFVGTLTWAMEGVLGTAAAFAKFGVGDGISMADLAKRNGAITSTWVNAGMQGSPFVTGLVSNVLKLPAGWGAANWALLAGTTQQTGVGQYSRAEALGMLPQVGGHGQLREWVMDPWVYGGSAPIDPRLTVPGHVGGVVEDSIRAGDPWYEVAWNTASDAVSSVAGVIGRGFINAMAGDLRPSEQFRRYVTETAGEQYVDETLLRDIDYFVRYAPDDPVFLHMMQEEKARVDAIAAANGP